MDVSKYVLVAFGEFSKSDGKPQYAVLPPVVKRSKR